jgi:hypothetical protein
MTRDRWVICGLLFFATTINDIDRAVRGVLTPALEIDTQSALALRHEGARPLAATVIIRG